jgi:imidazolonepropionase-like amidohydrolase
LERAYQYTAGNVFSPDYTTDDMINWPGMEFMTESTIDGWADYVNQIRSGEDYDEEQARNFLEIRNNLTFALHENGAGLMLGADAPQIFNPPGFSAHRELALLVDAGLSPFEALKTGTVNVGVYLEEENLIGKIAPGYRADLIILSSNPLESIPFRSRIEGVMSGGEYLDRSRLDSLLDDIKQVMNE